MPRHRLRGTIIGVACPRHGFIRGDHCSGCREEASEGIHISVWKPTIFNDICETPILIESKAQLKRECEKHGVRSYILPR